MKLRLFTPFRILLALGLACGLSGPASAQEATPPADVKEVPSTEAEQLAAAQELIRTAKMDQAFPRMLDEIMEAYRNELPAVPEEFWNNFAEKVDYSPVREALARLYMKEFSTKELKELNAFYASPVGKKLVERNLEIQRVFAIDSRDWARKTKQELVRQLKRKSYMY